MSGTERDAQVAPSSARATSGGDGPAVSVVVPVRDERPSLDELHARLSAVLGPDVEVIFVDDASSDGSGEALAELASRDASVRVLRFRRHQGKSFALGVGFRAARGRIVVTIDGDLQDDPAEIPKLLAALDGGLDVVGGWRRVRSDRTGKVRSSRWFNALVSLLSGVRFHDINCGLKAFRREVLDEIRLASGYHRFLPLLAHWRGFRVGEVEVCHHPRIHGRSKYGRLRSVRSLMDLAVLLLLERVDGRAGRLVAAFGAALAVSGGAILGGLFVLQRVTGSIQSRYPLLALGLLLVVVGLQFVSLGFIAELLSYHLRSRSRADPVVWSSTSPESGQDREA